MLFQETKSNIISEIKGYLCHWEREQNIPQGIEVPNSISHWSYVDKGSIFGELKRIFIVERNWG